MLGDVPAPDIIEERKGLVDSGGVEWREVDDCEGSVLAWGPLVDGVIH